ncbi:MAG: DUF3795 domain-containing protein [Actinobacteria bacterium]|jgi:hypothetical protein|nr:MAG: DUF3795 domain-containing protein [Actinomycetota bacterium]
MTRDRDLTAYCGLYCGDCIPSNTRLFEMIEELQELAAKLRLYDYAELLSRRDAACEDYPAFERMLAALAGWRCPSPCRAGGGRPSCLVRECAREKGFDGCWECANRRGCELLDPLRGFHRGTIDENLDAIAERGIDGWADGRGRHYPWS